MTNPHDSAASGTDEAAARNQVVSPLRVDGNVVSPPLKVSAAVIGPGIIDGTAVLSPLTQGSNDSPGQR